jgi:hypothetical protein
MIFFYLLFFILIARESKLVFASEVELELKDVLSKLHGQFKDVKICQAKYQNQASGREKGELGLKWGGSLDIFHDLFNRFRFFSDAVFYSSFYTNDFSKTNTAIDILGDYFYDIEFITFFWGFYYCQAYHDFSLNKWQVVKFSEIKTDYQRYRIAVLGIETFIKSKFGNMKARNIDSQTLSCRFNDYYLEYLGFIPLSDDQSNGPNSERYLLEKLKNNPSNLQAFFQN